MVPRTDERGACTYGKEAWRAFTGRRLEQERENGWTDALHPDDAIRFQLAMDHALDRRAPLSVDLRLRHRSGAYRWVRYLAHSCRDPSGAPAGYMGVCLDIETEHAQAMRLASAQIWMEHAREVVQLGGWEMEIATGRLETTEEAQRLLGRVADGDSASLEAWRGAVHPDDRPRVMASLEAVLSGKRQQYRTEYRLSQSDGSRRHFLAQGQTVMDRLGSPGRIVATVLDITERKRWAERARGRCALARPLASTAPGDREIGAKPVRAGLDIVLTSPGRHSRRTMPPEDPNDALRDDRPHDRPRCP